MPRVSVIMPVYNAGEAVAQAVSSVLAQTFADFELILSDDGSTDGCLDFVAGLTDKRVRLLSGSPNTGPVGARNRALRISEAPIVAIADADDLMHPLRLQRQVEFLDENPSVGLVAGAAHVFGPRSATGQISRPLTSHEGLTLGLRYGPSFFHSTVLVRTEMLRSIDGYSAVPSAEDYDLYARLLLSGCRFAAISDVVLFYRDHEGGISKIHAETVARVHRETSDHLRARVVVPKVGPLVRAARAEPRVDGPDPRLRMLKLLGRTAIEMRRSQRSAAFACAATALLMGPRSWLDLAVSSRGWAVNRRR